MFDRNSVFGLALASALVMGLGLAVAAPGCVGAGSDSGCPLGAEACACVPPGNLCMSGLSCISGYCVYLGGPDSGNGESGGEGDGDPAGDGDPGDGDPGDGDNDLCALLIDCVKEVQPESLSSYATLYGPSGSCYEIPGLTEQDCWAECDAIRESLAMLHPEVAACASYDCGDGKLDLDEACDGTSGCTPTCHYADTSMSHECNPVTQVPCDPLTERCIISSNEWDENYFFCANTGGEQPDAGLNESCYSDIHCADTNALCEYRSDCVEDYCCTATCYLGDTDEDFNDCPAGYTCTPVSTVHPGSWPAGTELIGLCF
jgi:hypothetical protein